MPFRPLVVERREIRTVDTNQLITGIDFYGKNTQGGAYGLREMNKLEYLELIRWIRWLYVQNQTVTLSYVASGGNLGNMLDERWQAGTATDNASSFRTEAQTPDISLVPTNWGKINLNYDTSIAYPNIKDYIPARPLRVGTTVKQRLREFTEVQFNDLIIDALREIGGDIGDGEPTVGRMGGYSIFRLDLLPTGNHDDGATFQDMGRVFEDTIANASAYTAAGIPETLDQPLALDNANRWNLYSMDAPASVPEPLPLVYHDGNGNIQEWAMGSMTQFFTQAVQSIAANGTDGAGGTGKLIWYLAGVTGSNTGNSSSVFPLIDEMENERLNGTSAAGYTVYPTGTPVPTEDHYRTQEFPNGTAQVYHTYSLRSYCNT